MNGSLTGIKTVAGQWRPPPAAAAAAAAAWWRLRGRSSAESEKASRRKRERWRRGSMSRRGREGNKSGSTVAPGGRKSPNRFLRRKNC